MRIQFGFEFRKLKSGGEEQETLPYIVASPLLDCCQRNTKLNPVESELLLFGTVIGKEARFMVLYPKKII